MRSNNLQEMLVGYFYKLKYQFLLKKAEIGSLFLVYCKLEVQGPGRVLIGNNCMIMPTVFGQDCVTLYTHSPEAKIIIGDNVILRGARLGCYTTIKIGNGSVVEGASLFDSDFHNIDATKRSVEYQGFNKPVVIGEGSYIGPESLIGRGTRLGSKSVVLAGTLMAGKSFAPDSVICGYPGKVRR